MKISTVLEQLTFGELKMLDLGGFTTDKSVQPANYAELLTHIRAGLLKLYTRFPIRERELKIIINPARTLYQLSPTKSFSSGSIDWFIQDSIESPFLGDILSISSVYDECGNPITLNDPNACTPVFIPTYETLQIPRESEGVLYVIYRAKPDVIATPDITSEEEIAAFLDTDLFLPDILQDALAAFVESRAYKSRNAEGSLVQSQAAMVNYENLCIDIEYRNTLNTSSLVSNVKLVERGFI